MWAKNHCACRPPLFGVFFIQFGPPCNDGFQNQTVEVAAEICAYEIPEKRGDNGWIMVMAGPYAKNKTKNCFSIVFITILLYKVGPTSRLPTLSKLLLIIIQTQNRLWVPTKNCHTHFQTPLSLQTNKKFISLNTLTFSLNPDS